MDKCHITDEKGDHIQDPADAEDAVFRDYVVVLEFISYLDITVRADSKQAAIELAKEEWTRSDIEYTYTYAGAE